VQIRRELLATADAFAKAIVGMWWH